MSKHRRPSRLARLRQAGPSPLQVGIAAGVAGTVAVTGTVVASASDSSSKVRTVMEGAAAQQAAQPPAATLTLPAFSTLPSRDAAPARTDVDQAQAKLAEQRAKAKARAIAKRKAEKRAAERRAARKRAAERRAVQARQDAAATASRGVERMSASASSVLAIAAATASGAYYTYGGAGPSGFDCSGFTSYVFSKVGVSLPHSSSAQAGMVQRVSSPMPGDLVFVYNGGGGSIGHVAIYAGGGYWWEAANPSMGVGKHRAWSSAVSYGRVL